MNFCKGKPLRKIIGRSTDNCDLRPFWTIRIVQGSFVIDVTWHPPKWGKEGFRVTKIYSTQPFCSMGKPVKLQNSLRDYESELKRKKRHVLP